MTPAAPLPVFSLVCKRDLATAVVCLRSFADHCRDDVRLTVVSDGTLDEPDLAAVRAAVPSAAVIDRAEVAAVVDPAVAGRPNCRTFRGIHAWALKLIDLPVYAAGRPFAFVDSDVLFVRDFTGLDRRAIGDVDLAYMHSYANIYSLGLAQRFRRWGRTPLADRCNSGLLYVAAGAYDLDFVEHFLDDVERNAHVLLAEQTGWAALAARTRSGPFDRRQVTFPFDRPSPDAVAVHFVGATRHLLGRASPDHSPDDGNAAPPPARLVVRPGSRLRLPGHLWDIVRHRLLIRRCRRLDLMR